MDKHLITAGPGIMMSKPVVAGTRITVELMLEKLAAGETMDRILSAHSRLTQEVGIEPRPLRKRAPLP